MPTLPTDFDLATESIRLRRLVPKDAPDLARLRNDAETMRWALPTGITEAEAAEAITGASEMWAKGEAAEFGIVSRDADNLLGTINLTFFGPARASIGFGVAPEARGDGVATQALRLVSAWSFRTFNDLIRLELWILPENKPSLRVAERAGFAREGVLRSRLPFGDEFRDVVSYSLLRSDSP